MDRCRVWEIHADPEIRRISKPGPEPMYPAYMVGDADKVVEEIQVAAVTKPKSPTDQVKDLFRRLLAGVAPPVPVPAPVPDVPVVEKLLQRLVAETQIHQPAPVVASEPVGLVPPDMGQIVRFDNKELALTDSWIDEVSVLFLVFLDICDLSIQRNNLEVGILDGDNVWLCLLSSVS